MARVYTENSDVVFSQGTLSGVHASSNNLKLLDTAPSFGYRISPSYDLSEVGNKYKSSKVSLDAVTPANTDAMIYTSIDNGVSWHNVRNGAPIPQLQGYKQDGVDDYASIPANNSNYGITTNYSCEAVFTPSSFTLDNVMSGIVCFNFYSGFYIGITTKPVWGGYYLVIAFYGWNPSTSQGGWTYLNIMTDATNSLKANNQYNISFTFNNGVIRVFKNGVFFGQYSLNNGYTRVKSDNRYGTIGAYYGNAGNFFKGTIHNITIWNTTLTDQKVIDNYSGKKTLTNRIADWRFNEGQGNIIHDYSPVGNHLTIPSTNIAPWSPLTGDYTGKSIKLKTVMIADTGADTSTFAVSSQTVAVSTQDTRSTTASHMIRAKSKSSRVMSYHRKVSSKSTSFSSGKSSRVVNYNRSCSAKSNAFVSFANRLVSVVRQCASKCQPLISLPGSRIISGIRSTLSKSLPFKTFSYYKRIYIGKLRFKGMLEKKITIKVVLDLIEPVMGDTYTLRRGDSKILEIEIIKKDEGPPVDLTGVTVNCIINSSPPIVKQCIVVGSTSGGIAQVKFVPSDTENILPLEYLIEFELIDGANDKYTIFNGGIQII